MGFPPSHTFKICSLKPLFRSLLFETLPRDLHNRTLSTGNFRYVLIKALCHTKTSILQFVDLFLQTAGDNAELINRLALGLLFFDDRTKLGVYSI